MNAPPPPPMPVPKAPTLAPVAPMSTLSDRITSSLMNRLPPAPPPAPDLPKTPRFSDLDSPPKARFPSFSMDLEEHMDHNDASPPRLPDITNFSQNVNPNGVHQDTHTLTLSDDTFPHSSGDSASEKHWDKPLDCDTMSSMPTIQTTETVQRVTVTQTVETIEDDDDDTGMDVPDRLTIGPGAAAARLDLKRCTVRVHRQLVNQIKTHSMKPATADMKNQPHELSRCQGELWIKSRVPMVGWKKRYGSIVDHAYFGPVLFLFRYDHKGHVALQNSMMIVLVDSEVRLGRNTVTRDGQYRCEFVLKTTKRRYVFAANHTMRRDYWIRNLESIQEKATTQRM